MFLIFAALVSASAVLVFPLNRALLAAMNEIKNDLIQRAEEYSGYEIEYASLGPSILSTLDLRNFRMVRKDGSVFLSVSRVRLSYSLLNLLRGKIADAFRSVSIDRPLFNLDFEKDASVVRLFTGRQKTEEKPAPGAASPLMEILPDNFQVRLRNGEWAALLSGLDFGIRNLSLDASIRRGGIFFQGSWNAWGSVDAPAFSGGIFSAEMSGRINGEYSGGGNGRASVSIPSLTGVSSPREAPSQTARGGFALKPLSLSLNLADDLLEIRKVYDRSPADISLYWNLRENGLEAAFFGENFLLRDIVTLNGSWREHAAWLETRLSGRAAVEKRGREGPSYRVDLAAAFHESSPVGNGTFVLNARGDSDKILFSECSLDSSAGKLAYSGELGFGPLEPNGLFTASNFGFRGGGEERISTELYISSRENGIDIFGENLRAGNAVLSALDASINYEEEGLSFIFSALRFKELETYGDVRMSSVTLEGSVDYEPPYVRASLSLDSFSVRDIAELMRPLSDNAVTSGPVLDALDGLYVTTEVFFNTDYEHILYNAPRFVAVYEGSREVLAIASISGTGQHFELDQGRISWPGRTADFAGFTDFSNPDDIEFSFQTSLSDITYYLEGSFLDRNSLSVRGSYGLNVYLSSAGISSWSGFAEADRIPFPQKDGQPAFLSFLFSLRYESPAFWTADIERFELVDLSTPRSSLAALRISGGADQNGLDIPYLFYDDGLGALSGSLQLDWDEAYREFNLAAEINGESGEERYLVDAAYTDTDEKLNVNLAAEKMQLSRILDSRNSVASGTVKLEWESINKFRADSELSSLVLRTRGGDMVIRASAVLDADEFSVNGINISYGGLEAVSPFLRVNRLEGFAETSAEVNGVIEGRGVDIKLRGNADFTPLRSWIGMGGIADSLTGSLVFSRAHYDSFEAEEPFSFIFSSARDENGREISVNGGPRNMVRFRYSPEENTGGGNFYAALSSPSPVRGSLTGYIDAQNIDAETRDLYVDLGSLWKLLPPKAQDTVTIPGGIASASIHVVGPLSDPDFYGTARGTSVRLRVPEYLTEDIRPAPVTVHLNGNEMNFGPAYATVGSGSGVVTAWFRFDGWIPNIFNMDITVAPENAVPFGFDVSGVIANGTASGNLKLAMENLVLGISGDLTAQNAEISLNSEELAAMEEESGWDTDATVTTQINLNIKTGRRVEFFWPSVQFPVLLAQADLGTGLNVKSDAGARTYSLTGDVRLRSGEIFYLERNFYIREGTLFFNEDETEFDPRISARAEIRDQGAEGPVTIAMIIDNAPLRSYEPRFESNPALSQFEIFSFLGQNPQDDPGRSRNALLSGGMDALTQFALIRRLQREVRNFLNLDMFSVRTQVLQNMVFQAAGFNDDTGTTTSPGAQEPDRNRVGNYFDKTTLFFGKYIGQDIFGRAMLTFRYDETKEEWGGMSVEPEIGLEMRNPLFDIEFNMAPLNMENWFIDSISFTLTKRITLP